MLYYVFESMAAAWDAQSAILASAVERGDAGHRPGVQHPATKRYAEPQPHPGGDGRAAIPANAGGYPTEQYRTSGAVALPEPVALGADWTPQGV